MKKANKQLGAWGEQLAADYLAGKGYEILARNWRYGRAEADIIAQIQQILVFVEVKTRKNAEFGAPDEGVSARKQQLLYELASEYMHQHAYEGEIRFDILAITGTAATPTVDIQHYADAFFPTW